MFQPVGVGRGPANTITCARNLQNANSTDVVSPNSDTLYCFIHLDLKKEPVVLVVPPVPADRYHTFEFVDAYTNVFAYIGTRATGSNGGTVPYCWTRLEGAGSSRDDKDMVSYKPCVDY